MRCFLAVIASVFVGQALAGQPGLLVVGVGQRSCGQFLAAVGNAPIDQVMNMTRDGIKYYSEQMRYNEWLMGFVSGINSTRQSDTDDQIKIDSAALDVWMRKWCSENPTTPIAAAAVAFRDQLSRR